MINHCRQKNTDNNNHDLEEENGDEYVDSSNTFLINYNFKKDIPLDVQKLIPNKYATKVSVILFLFHFCG